MISVSQNMKHSIYFKRNSASLELLNESILKKVMAKTDSLSLDSISINGYSDYLGNKEYNLVLSQKRADNIKDYLSEYFKKSVKYRTVHTNGLGEIYSPLTPPEGNEEHRKVDIVFYETPKRYTLNKTSRVRKFQSENGIVFNQVYILEQVEFLGDRADLLDSSIPELENFYKQVKQIEGDYKLIIKGHICCLDEDATDDDKNFSQTLSTARALRIQDYLVKRGIPNNFIEIEGYSFREPLVYPELTDSDRQTNRRVEAIVYK